MAKATRPSPVTKEPDEVALPDTKHCHAADFFGNDVQMV